MFVRHAAFKVQHARPKGPAEASAGAPKRKMNNTVTPPSGVSFLDSTALGALVTAAERRAAVHGALILTSVPTRVRRIIQITGLDTS